LFTALGQKNVSVCAAIAGGWKSAHITTSKSQPTKLPLWIVASIQLECSNTLSLPYNDTASKLSITVPLSVFITAFTITETQSNIAVPSTYLRDSDNTCSTE